MSESPYRNHENILTIIKFNSILIVYILPNPCAMTTPGTSLSTDHLLSTTPHSTEVPVDRAGEVRANVASFIAKATSEDPRRGFAILMASRSQISHADALALANNDNSIALIGSAAKMLYDPDGATSGIERLFGNIREIPFDEARAILQAEGLDTSLRGLVARSTRASWTEASTLLTDDRLGWPVREMLVSALPEIPLSEALPLLQNNAISTSVRRQIA